jgi:hypothetical protein
MNEGTWFWPDVSDLDGAKDAAKYGEWCSYIIAAFSAAIATPLIYSGHFSGIAWFNLGEAFLFLGLGFGIGKFYRAAAVLAFVAYFGEKLYFFIQTGAVISAGVFGVIFLLGLFNGIRGVFAYHKLSKASATEQSLAPVAPDSAP